MPIAAASPSPLGQFICTDLLSSLPSAALPQCISCLGRFVRQMLDLNVALTAVGLMCTRSRPEATTTTLQGLQRQVPGGGRQSPLPGSFSDFVRARHTEAVKAASVTDAPADASASGGALVRLLPPLPA